MAPPELSKPVRQIMARVTELTGKDFDFVRKNDLVPQAGVKLARPGMPRHIIQYRDAEQSVLNHLVAHECGHVIRMTAVPPERRLVPASNRRTMTAALSPLVPEMERISRAIPHDRAPAFFSMLYNGLVRQLTNFPSDIAIENWLFDEFAELRLHQFESLVRQRNEAAQGLGREARALTPSLIYEASNVMNCTFYKLLGDHMGRSMLGRFAGTEHETRGRELAEVTAAGPLNTYEDDIAMVNRWADFLGLSGWYVWVPFDQVPSDYANS
jgi:hypothetical protein